MGWDDGRAVSPVDWDRQALWVQDRLMYVLDADDVDADVLTVLDQTGRRLTFDRKVLETTHVAVLNRTVYKPRFRPVQAYCPGDTIRVELDGQPVLVAAGDAILRDRDGRISVMPRHDFNSRYQFVAASGAEPPI